MADFKIALDVVLQNEGKYSNRPDDPGGETYKGISRRSWGSWAGWQIIDANKDSKEFPANLEQIPLLQTMVIEFYQKEFWKFDKLNSQPIANKLLDMCVNMGSLTGIRLAQTGLIRRFGVTPKLDGLWDDLTKELINRCPADAYLNELRAQAAVHYTGLVLNRTSNQIFLLGWMRRAVQ